VIKTGLQLKPYYTKAMKDYSDVITVALAENISAYNRFFLRNNERTASPEENKTALTGKGMTAVV